MVTKGVNSMEKVWKYVEVIRELDNAENIQIRFSILSRELLKTLAMKLKKPILSSGTIV